LKTKEEYVKHGKKVNQMQDDLAAKTEENEKIVAEIKKLDALENPQNAKLLETLRSLISLNESLRSQEALFRANCKKQMTQLKEMIETLQRDQYVPFSY
jgi:ribosome-binding protein aMBF1 (putative translation factor)